MYSNSLIELDRAHLVHPVASYRGHEQQGVRVLSSAKGATVTDAQGRQLIDGFAGLWCVNACCSAPIAGVSFARCACSRPPCGCFRSRL